MPTVDLKIENMHCGACVRRVSQAIQAVPSAHADSVAVGSARVSTADPAELLRALKTAGYPARVAGQGA